MADEYIEIKVNNNNIPIDGCYVLVDQKGVKRFFQNGVLHRDDGPAVIFKENDYEWYRRGHLHRDNGPAIEKDYGQSWYRMGLLHRTDGPAYIMPERKAWAINGVVHRVGAPAIIYSNGDEEWYFHGELHRLDGPAKTYKDGSIEYYLNGEHIGPRDYDKKVKEYIKNNIKEQII